MEQILNFIIEHRSYAPWITCGLILLAGFNFPISIDIIIVISAFLAATTLTEQAMSFYLSILIGTYFSAWIAYWLGRTLGSKLLKLRWFSKILHQERLKKVHLFYDKHGFFTLLLGRFIPFGVRNCIFITTGMSRSNFKKFALRDCVACFAWVTICFYSFYTLGMNYQILLNHLKIVNLVIFSAFSVTVIGVICYKKHKSKNS